MVDFTDIILLLNQANSVDIISCNEDKIFGMNANFFLAGVNRRSKVRYIQSKSDYWHNMPVIDKIFYEFGENPQIAYVFNNLKVSCIIINSNLSFYTDNQGTVLETNILDFKVDADIALQKFEILWKENYNITKIRTVKVETIILNVNFYITSLLYYDVSYASCFFLLLALTL